MTTEKAGSFKSELITKLITACYDIEEREVEKITFAIIALLRVDQCEKEYAGVLAGLGSDREEVGFSVRMVISCLQNLRQEAE